MQLISYLLWKEEDFGYKHWSIRRLTIIPPYEPAHLQTQKLTFDGNGALSRTLSVHQNRRMSLHRKLFLQCFLFPCEKRQSSQCFSSLMNFGDSNNISIFVKEPLYIWQKSGVRLKAGFGDSQVLCLMATRLQCSM